MTENQKEQSKNRSDIPLDELTHEEKILVVLREDLYEGSWDKMEQDLQDRLDGKPYIFKLHNRIEDDLNRIEKLKDFEDEHEINLADHLEYLDTEDS